MNTNEEGGRKKDEEEEEYEEGGGVGCQSQWFFVKLSYITITIDFMIKKKSSESIILNLTERPKTIKKTIIFSQLHSNHIPSLSIFYF